MTPALCGVHSGTLRCSMSAAERVTLWSSLPVLNQGEMKSWLSALETSLSHLPASVVGQFAHNYPVAPSRDATLHTPPRHSVATAAFLPDKLS